MKKNIRKRIFLLHRDYSYAYIPPINPIREPMEMTHPIPFLLLWIPLWPALMWVADWRLM